MKLCNQITIDNLFKQYCTSKTAVTLNMSMTVIQIQVNTAVLMFDITAQL